MTRLSPSRHAVHRSLRIPDLRAGDDSPLRTSCHRVVPSASRSRRLSTKGLHRCVPSATFQTRLQPCVDGLFSPSSEACRDVHVAPLKSHAQSSAELYDAVKLEPWRLCSDAKLWIAGG